MSTIKVAFRIRKEDAEVSVLPITAWMSKDMPESAKRRCHQFMVHDIRKSMAIRHIEITERDQNVMQQLSTDLLKDIVKQEDHVRGCVTKYDISEVKLVDLQPSQPKVSLMKHAERRDPVGTMPGSPDSD